MYDVAIIGGGAAGLTAAIYACRNDKKVIVFEGETIGGQIAESPLVENYPSIMEISGLDFSDNLRQQAEHNGANIEYDEILSIEYRNNKVCLSTHYSCFVAKCLIFATGCKPRRLGLKNEDDLIGNGIAYCAVCDGAFFKGRDVAVVGGGDSALQEAVFLSNICSSVSIIHRREEFRADAFMVEKAVSKKNIKYILNSVVEDMTVEDDGSKTYHIRNTKSNELSEHKFDCLFVAIGRIPKSELAKDYVDMDKSGFIIADESCKTKTPWFFVAGDIRQKSLRQLTTAMADGSVAAVNACEYLDSLQ